jgi:hypothetical protein
MAFIIYAGARKETQTADLAPDPRRRFESLNPNTGLTEPTRPAAVLSETEAFGRTVSAVFDGAEVGEAPES